VRRDFREPVLLLLELLEEFLQANMHVTGSPGSGFQESDIPDVPWWVAREAVLNALVHRDLFLNEPVQIELHTDRLDVVSPGGFIGGVSPANVLRHPPVRRNPLLAGVLQILGFVNRAGMGVDRIYEETLRLGKAFPAYEADEAHIRLRLRTPTNGAFARFVASEISKEHPLSLDDLIVLRAAFDRGFIDRWSAAEYLQLDEAGAAEALVRLRQRGYLQPSGRGRGTSYRLSRRPDSPPGLFKEASVRDSDEAAARDKIRAVLAEAGRLTNAEIRRLTGLSRTAAARMMGSLIREKKARLVGSGRGAHYVASRKRPGRGRPG
jgi:ATP-dependent DNA helicase RecG